MTVLEYCSGRIATRRGNALAEGVYFSVQEGETLALIGETGSGKTIIARSIMKLLPDDVEAESTRIEFCGRDITHIKRMKKLLGREIVYIPQSGHECLNPSKTVKSQLLDGLKAEKTKRKLRINSAFNRLRAVGFDDPESVLKKYPFELSGGMAQRVVIAMALNENARLVICDEPTNGIDEEGRDDTINLIKDLFPTAGIIIITHDMSVAEKTDKTAVLCKGKILETGETAKIINEPKTPYTKALIKALVKNGMKETMKLRSNDGDCPFYARCGEADNDCLNEIKYKTADNVRYRCRKY